jgi:hypothetical protein
MQRSFLPPRTYMWRARELCAAGQRVHDCGTRLTAHSPPLLWCLQVTRSPQPLARAAAQKEHGQQGSSAVVASSPAEEQLCLPLRS